MTQLTPHFTLEELTHTDHREIDNTPPESETVLGSLVHPIENLKRLADFLEMVKLVVGNKAVMINSGYRCKALNDSVGSKDSSQHRVGCAADIRIPGMTPDEVVKAIIASGISYDQVIREFDRWTHVSIPNHVSDAPRRQALIIDKAGTRPYA